MTTYESLAWLETKALQKQLLLTDPGASWDIVRGRIATLTLYKVAGPILQRTIGVYLTARMSALSPAVINEALQQ